MANRQGDGATIDPRDALAHNTAQRYKAYSDYKGVLDERGNALIEVNEKSGPRSKAYIALEEKLKREDSQLVKIKSAVRRPLSRWQVRAWVIMLVGLGLALLEALNPPAWLLGYYLWDATLGELYRRQGNHERATEYLRHALDAAPTHAEKALIQRRMKACAT